MWCEEREMAIDTGVPRTRRALLVGGIGGLVAMAASTLGRPLPTRAADGETVTVGSHLTATTYTSITNETNDDTVIRADSSTGTGIVGASASGTGVSGISNSWIGVYGRSSATDRAATVGRSTGDSTGVLGFSSAGLLPAVPAKTGVYGHAVQDADSRGVFGLSTAGHGVHGESQSGIGVDGSSEQSIGVHGYSTSSTGVNGGSESSFGVRGYSVSGIGVHGSSGGTTGVQGWSPSETGVRGDSTTGTGVVGVSSSGAGVSALSGSGTAMLADSGASDRAAAVGRSKGDSTGVLGYSGHGSIPTPPAKTGIYGYAAQDADAVGVQGRTTAGRGVFGQATSGVGVRGTATSGTAGSFEATAGGYALRAVGRVKLDKCAGVATIAQGTRSILVTPGIDLTSLSAVVATLQGSPGGTTTVQRVAISTTANTFTIHLTANSTAAVKVAWHVFG
jgi:hypothetical protein